MATISLPTTQTPRVQDFSDGLRPSGGSGPSLFEGAITDTLSAVSQGMKFFKEATLDGARDGLQSVKDELDTRVREDEIAAGLPSGPLPPEVAKAKPELERVRRAYEAGAIDSDNYNSRLDVAARRLRARYPGWRDEIDKVVSGVVGYDPSNKMVSDLLRERDRNRKGSESELADLRKEARSLGLVGVVSRIGTEDEPSERELRLAVVRSRATNAELDRMKAQQDMRRGALNLTEAEQKALDRTSEQMGVVKAYELVGAAYEQRFKVGGRYVSVGDFLNEAAANPNQTMTPENKAAAEALGRELLRSSDRSFQSTFVDGPLGRGLSAESLKKIKETMTAEVARTVKLLADGDISLISIDARQNKYRADGNELAVRRNSTIAENMQSAVKLFGPDVTRFALASSGSVTRVNKEVEQLILSTPVSAAPGTASPSQMVRRVRELDGSATAGDVTRLWASKATDSKAPAEIRNAYFQALNGTGSQNFLLDLKESEREGAFSFLTAPTMASTARDLEKNFPGTVDRYKSWSTRQGQMLAAPLMDNLSQINAEGRGYHIEFSDTEGRFKLVDERRGSSFSAPSSIPPVVAGYVDRANRLVFGVGTALTTQAGNLDTKALQAFVAASGFKPKAKAPTRDVPSPDLSTAIQ